MEIINLNNKFFDFKLFVLPETKNIQREEDFCPFLVLVDKKDYDELNQDLLKKIIGALKFDFSKDVLVMEYEIGTILEFQPSSCRVIISFGIPLKHLGIHFSLQKYDLLQHRQHQFLLADTLKEISADKKLKGTLWASLQGVVKE